MAGWGTFFGKVAEWMPGRREAKQNEIDRLLRENEQLQKQHPLSSRTVDRIMRNADRINQLRRALEKIN
ncbi:MAG TPA: hypothetical protein V6D12_14235 [Candidatus Obscuribacterales bacterium]